MEIPATAMVDPPDAASPEQPPHAASPEPRPLSIVEPCAAAGAGELLGGADAVERRTIAGGVEARAAADAVQPRAGERLAGAGGVEPRAAADVVDLRAWEPLAGVGGVEPRAVADVVEPRAWEPLAGAGGVEPHAVTEAANVLQNYLRSAKLWNALDSDFAAAMDVELAIPLNTVEPEVQFLPRLMPAPSTQRPREPSWVPPEGVMRQGNREDYSLPIDADTTNYKDFLDDIAEKYSLPLDDIETIQYNDGRKKHSICRDQDLTAMFDCFEPTKKGRVTIIMKDIDKYLENPFPQFEHIGVNEENQYLAGESGEGDDDDSDTDDEYEPSEGEEGEDVEESIEESADDEEWVAKDAKPDIAPAVAYDMDDPPMEVGTIYPSIKMLRLAVAQLWTRSKFSPNSKVDYVTNNLAECFNNWIHKHKGLMLFELCDTIRKKLMAKFLKRKRVANRLQGHIILPSVMKELHAKSRNLDFDLERNDNCEAEVTERGPNGKRHIVDLEQRTCTCREWQVSGKPCAHALCFLSAIRFKLEPYVHDCYSVSKFKAAYAPRIPALTDISQWPKNTHDFYLHPPILKRSAGRPSTERVKSAAEGKPKGRKGRHQCPICKGYGHSWKKCKEADPEAKEAYAKQPKKRPKVQAISTSTQAIDVVSATTSDQLVATSAATTHGSALQLVAPGGSSTAIVQAATPPAKRRGRSKRQYVPASPDSPSMGTRSKKRLASPDSPSMGTRSKKRLAV
ncbi:hypothetical protein ACP70R_002048 [Stipagrostis hirtigluma subsp. patula]